MPGHKGDDSGRSLGISVIVPFHKNLTQLRQCLEAVREAGQSVPEGAHIDEIIVAADGARDDPEESARAVGAAVVSIRGPLGPAVARNRAAATASGDLLVFVDTDVVMAPDTLARFARLFMAEPALGAAFGSYDDAPADPGFLSQCRNLAHACIHQRANRKARTFWAGLGAVRADVFARVGGFDERFRRPSVEDIDLGYRINAAGSSITLDPAIRGKHLKRWTFRSGLTTDIRDRGVPWVQLMRRYGGMANDLNLTFAYRACVVVAYLLVIALAGAWWKPVLLAWAFVALGALWLLDWPYYRFFIHHRGLGFTLRWFPFHILHHLTNGLSFVAGTTVAVARDLTGLRLPGSLPATPWPLRPAARTRASGRKFSRLGLLGVLLLAGWMGARGLGSDSYAAGGGDDARYLMNGVYMLDLLRDRPFASVDTLIEYTRLYYARYPALSLGHHPPLTSAAEVPLFATFGVSVVAGRLVELLSFLLATAFLYRLVKELYEPVVAVLAASFFATSPMIVQVSLRVWSEMPTIALVIASIYYLHRFLETRAKSALIWFVVSATLSLYAKQLAVFMFPAYLVVAMASLGVRRLVRRDVLIAAAAIGLLALPLVPMTLVLSKTNVNWALATTHDGQLRAGLLEILRMAFGPQLIVVVLLLAAAGIIRAAARRDRRALLFVAWTGSVALGLVFTGEITPARYTVYWIPALSVLAASFASGWSRAIGTMLIVGSLAVAGVQAHVASRYQLTGIGEYEEAARFVLASDPGPTVMFSGDFDTGFFSFFVRKHDVDRRLVVLRADKMLTTSLMGRLSVEDRIQAPAQIYDILHQFGARYVVIEDRPSSSHVLEWLRTEVRSSRFVERKRIAIDVARSLSRSPVVIYELLDATPPDPRAVLSMHVPLVSQTVAVPLSDLINRKYLR